MKNSLFQRAAQFYKEQRRKKLWHRIVSGMACVVVFCTVYALILPAITLEKDPVCGMVEHTHTEECYAVETVWPSTEYRCDEVSLSGHAHNGSCYDEHDELVCGYADVVVHTHNSLCYDQNGRLSCPLEEIEEHQHSAVCFRTQNVLTCEEAETGHIHNDQCFTRTRGELICGQEEQTGHTHGSACYDTTQILVCGLTEDGEHSHGESCYETQKTLACKQAESAGHTHTDDCYAWTKTPVCGKEENLEGHIHTSDCYTVKTEQICGKEELLLHTHSDACFGRDGNLICGKLQVLSHEHSVDCVTKPEGGSEEVQTLICGLDEHTHTDQCYIESGENAYNCGLAEHTHGADCYDETGNLTCTLLEHVHNETCLKPAEPETPDYVCGKEAHTHGEDCYDENGGLICTLPEHTHDETCLKPAEPEMPEYICGRTEHTHGADCYDENGNLTCTLREHVHTEQCLAPAEGVQQELTYEGEDYTVTVSFGKEAALPDGVTLSVREIQQGTEEYESYSRQTQAALAAKQTEGAERVLFARFFDVQLMLNGQEVEPSAPVTVTVTYDKKVDVTGRDVSCQTVHFAEDGPEILKTESADDPDSGATSFTHTQDSFSVMVCLVTQKMANETDIGPNDLPVDYYVCIDDKWTRVGATRTGWYGTKTDKDEWSNENRDYITVDQAKSILGEYKFPVNASNPARNIAYQQKTGSNLNLYSDTETFTKSVTQGTFDVIPLAINKNGYNLYYLPANTGKLDGVSLDKLDKAANSFYTVTVVDGKSDTPQTSLVLSGGSFTYTVPVDSEVEQWLVAYANGTNNTVSADADGKIKLTNITSAVQISPAQISEGVVGRSVTFKVLIDGTWQEVGSLPYYYKDSSGAYITSDMAEQVLGGFGYDENTEGREIGYSYNDVYTICYAGNTKYCMDVQGGTIEDSRAIQLYERNYTPAQIFRIWRVDDTSDYCFITPINNSGYHVNVLGGGAANGTKLALRHEVDKASQWKVVHNNNGTVCFYNANADTSAAIDLPNGNVGSTSNPPQLHIWANGNCRYWTLDQCQISNDTQIKKLTDDENDTSKKISLPNVKSDGDIVCYYMPGVTSKIENEAESKLPTNGNQFWSVKVVDESQGVYTVAQQESMTQYVKNGGSATVTVKKADGVSWACRGMNNQADVKAVVLNQGQNDPYTEFQITEITQPIEVTATRVNPQFTVQYYAWTKTAADSGTTALDIIDTSASGTGTGGNLPKNGEDPKLKYVYLGADHKLATVTKLLEVYSAKECVYETSRELKHVNKLADNNHYELKEIWTLNSGCDPASTSEADWTVYKVTDIQNVKFTNTVPKDANEIMVTDTMVLRLVYDESTSTYTNAVNFYDYDISDGSKKEKTDGQGKYWQTNTTINNGADGCGINSSSNYGDGAKLAFGNKNTGVECRWSQRWNENELNCYNHNGNGYKGCTFGLVDSLENSKTIQYASGVAAPKLFNETGSVTGKTSYDNGQYSLKFNREGDTYTLTAVNNAGQYAQSLDTFTEWEEKNWSNNFWPMDAAVYSDTEKHDFKFGYYEEDPNNENRPFKHFKRYGAGYWSAMPQSDDNKDHNSYFGMYYAVNFDLTADYVGPLEYYFYGDDDMWVFLDDTLVCDIGGVHSTVGEYVNLWDYIEKGKAGEHKLSFFYTERGASGSTCYMRFTLPSVSGATPRQDVGQLQISKTLKSDSTAFSDVEYAFQVELLTKEGGDPLTNVFSYSCTDSNGTSSGTVTSGDIIKLKKGQTVLIKGLPAGTYYKVTELTTEGYTTTVTNAEGTIIPDTATSGSITTRHVSLADFVNTPVAYTLPVTGNTGPLKYTLEGLCLTAGALFLVYKRKIRGKGGKADPC